MAYRLAKRRNLTALIFTRPVILCNLHWATSLNTATRLRGPDVLRVRCRFIRDSSASDLMGELPSQIHFKFLALCFDAVQRKVEEPGY